jgi:hypothetical protein
MVPGLEVTAITLGEEEARIARWQPLRDEMEREEELLVPLDLQSLLGSDDATTELAPLSEEEEEDDDFAYFKRINFCIENDISIPLEQVMGDFSTLPPVEALSDEDAERWLKLLLGQLALRGITLDICEHFTARDSYHYLVKEVLPEAGFIPEAGENGWVQHFSTWEDCPRCSEEIQADWPSSGDADDAPF